MFEQTFETIEDKLWKGAGSSSCDQDDSSSNLGDRLVFLQKKIIYRYNADDLELCQKLINAENSDLFDVLEYVAYAINPIPREKRVAQTQSGIFDSLNAHEREFLEFVLMQYIETGVDELAILKLPELLKQKYATKQDAIGKLGSIEKIRSLFIGFQKHLYLPTAA